MSPITEDELEAIEARANAATPGVWTWEDDPPTLYAGRSDLHHGYNLLGRLALDWNGANNMDFICHSHQDVPRLAAEVRRLRAELAAEREACAAVADDHAPADPTDSRHQGAQEACRRIAAAIRARGQA